MRNRVTRKAWLKITIVAVFCILLTHPAYAESTKALTLQGSPGWHNNFSNSNVGFSFTTNEELFVTHLGAFDYDKNGFADYRTLVGIFEEDGALLGSTNVVSDDSLDGWFRFRELGDPIILEKNTTYYAIAYLNGGEQVAAQSSISTDPNINFGHNAYAYGGPFKLVTNTYGSGWDAGFFGPNFKSTVTPEPMSCLLFLAGGVPVVFRRLKKCVSPDS